jgi:hypothetical protein
MRTVVVNKVHAYDVAFDVSLIALNIFYGIDGKVKLMYVIGDKIIGYITTQKLHYTNKGAYIKYFSRRIYMYEFAPVDFYGMEFRGSSR